MTEPTSPYTPAVRVLAMSRGRPAAYLALSAVFVAVGVLTIPESSAAGWLVTGLGACSALVFAANLVRPATLRLDANGFFLAGPTRPSRRREWFECSAFTIWRSAVLYHSGKNNLRLLRSVDRALSGGDEYIPAGFGGLNASRLADLMNQYRNTAADLN